MQGLSPAEAIFDAEREIVFGPHRSVQFAYMRMRGGHDDKAMREKRPAAHTAEDEITLLLMWTSRQGILFSVRPISHPR